MIDFGGFSAELRRSSQLKMAWVTDGSDFFTIASQSRASDSLPIAENRGALSAARC
jgi:hypothetical protein